MFMGFYQLINYLSFQIFARIICLGKKQFVVSLSDQQNQTGAKSCSTVGFYVCYLSLLVRLRVGTLVRITSVSPSSTPSSVSWLKRSISWSPISMGLLSDHLVYCSLTAMGFLSKHLISMYLVMLSLLFFIVS